MADHPTRPAFYTDLLSGLTFVVIGLVLLDIIIGSGFMTRFMPAGRPSSYDLIVGALAWSLAVTAPTGFVWMGVARLKAAYKRWLARRPE